jgi:hypothetical protein
MGERPAIEDITKEIKDHLSMAKPFQAVGYDCLGPRLCKNVGKRPEAVI